VHAAAAGANAAGHQRHGVTVAAGNMEAVGVILFLLGLPPSAGHVGEPAAAATAAGTAAGTAMAAVLAASPPLPQPPNLTGTNFRYLGFWGQGTPAEMQGFTNLAFANDARQAIEQHRHGISPLLKSHDLCLNYTTRWHLTLRPDCREQLAAASRTYIPLLENGTALGFFLGDELLWNGLSFASLQTYVRLMRSAFPPPAVLYYNEAWPSLLPTPAGVGEYVGDVGHLPAKQLLQFVPRELDWFSVDIYPDTFSSAGLPIICALPTCTL